MTQSLEQALGLEPGTLAFLEYFSEEEQARLLSLFETAQTGQRQRVDEAIESGLQIVPGFLRKTLRKILGSR